MFNKLSEQEIRSLCRTSIENMELWARRLIDDELTKFYGNDYFNTKENERFYVKKEIREKATRMMIEDSNRFHRLVDTLFLDEIKYFLLNNNFYSINFKKALDYIYPNNKEMARIIFDKIISIRNPLSHSNPISIRQAEQAICYSNDFIEGLKQYYKEKGEEKMWNVPQIIRLVDSKGFVAENITNNGLTNIIKPGHELFVGDTYSIEITIDPTYTTDQYTIQWEIVASERLRSSRNKYCIKIENKHVSKLFIIKCKVISKKDWHKYQTYDHQIFIHLTVLPPN